MSKNRWVNTRFWGDNYIMDLEPREKLLFLYCLTNDHTSLCGAYELNLRLISLETGFDTGLLLSMFEKFKLDGKISYVDGYVVVRNYRKYQSSNESVKQGIEREEKELPKTVLDSLHTACTQPVPTVRTVSQDFTLLNLTKLKPNGNTVAEAAPALEKNEVFRYWEECVSPVTGEPVSIETQRKASVTLFNRYGVEQCKKMIRIVVMAHSDQYARKEYKPLSLLSLLGNWDKVLIYAKGKHTQMEKSSYIPGKKPV